MLTMKKLQPVQSIWNIDDVSYRSGYIHLKRTGEALLETEDRDIPREIPHLLENCFKPLNKREYQLNLLQMSSIFL